MAGLLPHIFKQYLDDNGDPLASGTINSYGAGTVVDKDTFTTVAGDVANANPIVLDASGRTTIWLEEGSYDFVIKDSLGNIIDTEDSVPGSTGTGAASLQMVETIAELKALASGSSEYTQLGGYYANGDGGGGLFYWDASSVASDDGGLTIVPDSVPGSGRWIRINTGTFSVKEFGAKGDGTTDDRLSINNALAAAANGGKVYFPDSSSDYMISDVLSTASSSTITIEWAGSKSYLKLSQATASGGIFSTGSGADLTFNEPRIDADNIIGQNGIGTNTTATVRINGGHLLNFPVANDYTGGKAIASDGWGARLFVDGVRVQNCHSALSLKRDFSTDASTNNPAHIVVNNIIAEDCDIFAYMAVKNLGVGSFDGTEMSVSITNFKCFDCGLDLPTISAGTHGGVFLFDRATQVTISNGVITNQPTYNSSTAIQSIFRGRARELSINNIQIDCDADSIINIDPVPNYAIDTSAMANNSYNLVASGTYDYLYLSDTTDATHPNRFLDNTDITCRITNDVNTSLVTAATRNGTGRIRVLYNSQIATGTPSYFNSNFTTMANVPTTHTEDYDTGTWTPSLEGTTGTVGAYAVSEANGRWTKIGRMIYINCYLILTDKGSWTGNVKITGIPANAAGTTGYESHSACLLANTTVAGEYVMAEIARTSQTYITLQEIYTGAGVTVLPMTAITNSSRIAFSMAYEI
jgi:hypothetical protein